MTDCHDKHREMESRVTRVEVVMERIEAQMVRQTDLIERSLITQAEVAAMAKSQQAIATRLEYQGKSMDDFSQRLSRIEGAGPWQTWATRLVPAAIVAACVSWFAKHMGG